MTQTGAVLATRSGADPLTIPAYEPAESSPSLFSLSQEGSGWRTDAERRIRDLRWLAPEWDGPASPAVTQNAREMALFVVARLSGHDDRLRAPTVTPTPFGGVFVEWHSTACTVAFTVDANGAVEISYDDMESGIEREEADPCRRELADEWLPLLAKHRV